MVAVRKLCVYIQARIWSLRVVGYKRGCCKSTSMERTWLSRTHFPLVHDLDNCF
jgi:hypothetical protein